jgi:glycerol-3-phosphate dehydrogenase
MEEHAGAALPIYSIIGGKLTTCRSLAESSAATILGRLGLPVQATSRERPLPGGEADEKRDRRIQYFRRFEVPHETIDRLWSLFGSRMAEICDQAADLDEGDWRIPLPGTWLPRGVARWVVQNEWVTRLDDLVERRLMLLYEPKLGEACLRELAALLVEAGKLPAAEVNDEVNRTIARLAEHFDKHVLARSSAS